MTMVDLRPCLAMCKLLHPLRALDLSLGHGQSSLSGPILGHLLGERELTTQEKEKAVWIEIDNAFSTPVTQSEALLRRSLGEHISIELALAADLWPTLIDPGQLENVTLNMAINARDVRKSPVCTV